MQNPKLALFGAAGLAAILAGGAGCAQPAQRADTVTVPPGYVAVMVPQAEAIPISADPLALQLDALLAAPLPFPVAMPMPMPLMAAWTGNPAAAAVTQLPPVHGPVGAEVITSVSRGPEHFTQRVVYPTMNGSGRPQVSDYGNACRALARAFQPASDTADRTRPAPGTAAPGSGTSI